MKSSDRPLFRIFLVRPWHNPASAASPYLTDGVEHVQSVVIALRDAVELYNKNPASPYTVELNLDETVFKPGRHLLAQLNREMQRTDLALVILDGLRPNVVFEYGLMLGHLQGAGTDQADNFWERVIGLRASDATVLVRNYYPDKLHAPTFHGAPTTPMNPPLDIQSHFSDIAGLFLHYYDRHNIFGSIRDWFRRFLDTEIANYEPLRSESSASVEDTLEEDDDAQQSKLWGLYRDSRYEEITEKAAALREPDELQVLALSYMRLNQVRDAVHVWQRLSRTGKLTYTVDLHLGICHYILRDFASASFHLKRAAELETRPGKADLWLRRLEGRAGDNAALRSTLDTPHQTLSPAGGTVEVECSVPDRYSRFKDVEFAESLPTVPTVTLKYLGFVPAGDDEPEPAIAYEAQRLTRRGFRLYMKSTEYGVVLPLGDYRFECSIDGYEHTPTPEEAGEPSAVPIADPGPNTDSPGENAGGESNNSTD